MLQWRLVAAAGIIGPLLLLVWLDDVVGRPGIWLGPLAVVISLAACHEVNHLLASANLPVSRGANLFAVGCVSLASLAPLAWAEYPADCPVGKLGWTMLGLALGVAAQFLWELKRYQQPGQSIVRLIGGAFTLVYAGLMMSFLIQLRFMGGGRLGLLALISTILIVKLSDAGAFFVGKSLGRTHWTRVSPGKTVEGLIGGLLFALLGSWLTFAWLLPTWAPNEATRGPVWCFLVYGSCLAVAGVIGDLAESLLKRDAQEKDSSHWLPGLGGVLDVIDSLLAAAPVSLVWWSTDWLIR